MAAVFQSSASSARRSRSGPISSATAMSCSRPSFWRREGADKWLRVPMVLHDNDRWAASFTPPKAGRYVYAIEAWTDVFASWRRDFLAKRAAGMDVGLEIEEGRNLLTDLRFK